MLVDAGKLVESDGAYRPVGDLGSLSVPERLASLIAARLDALDPADRSLLQDGAVLGQTFTVVALSALSGIDLEALERQLRALVQRELLTLDTDPRSPERGQFGFTQSLIREVAYSTLSKRDRRAKHLAAARFFEALGEDEVAGVLATHYVDAYEAAPEGPEGQAIAGQARIALLAAAERAAGLGAQDSAIAYWQRVRTITADPAEEAAVLEKIGFASRNAGHYEGAEAAFKDAIDRYRVLGDRLGAARASVGLGKVLGSSGRLAEAMSMVEAAATDMADLAPDRALIELWLAVASGHSQLARQDAAIPIADRALADAETLRLPDLVADGMLIKGGAYVLSGRVIEGRALIEAAGRVAEANGLGIVTARAAFTLALSQIEDDPRTALETSRQAIELTRRYGLGPMRLTSLANAAEMSAGVGDWAWIDAELDRVDRDDLEPPDQATLDLARAEISALRGRDTTELIASLTAFAEVRREQDVMTVVATARAVVAIIEGKFEDAIDAAAGAEDDDLNGPTASLVAGRAAVRLGDVDRARAALDRLAGARIRGTAMMIHRDELAASVAALEGRWSDAVAAYSDAWRRYRELRLDASLAISVTGCLIVAPAGDPFAERAIPEARAILEREGATAYLAQLEAVIADRASREVRRARCAPCRPARARRRPPDVRRHAGDRGARSGRRAARGRPDGASPLGRGERRVPGHPGRGAAADDRRPARPGRLRLRPRAGRSTVRLAEAPCPPRRVAPVPAGCRRGQGRDRLRTRDDHAVRFESSMAGDHGCLRRVARGRGHRRRRARRQRPPRAS